MPRLNQKLINLIDVNKKYLTNKYKFISLKYIFYLFKQLINKLFLLIVY